MTRPKLADGVGVAWVRSGSKAPLTCVYCVASERTMKTADRFPLKVVIDC